jgi:hypothetical protein
VSNTSSILSNKHQITLLTLERETTAHALLIEAVDEFFRKHGKKPIA